MLCPNAIRLIKKSNFSKLIKFILFFTVNENCILVIAKRYPPQELTVIHETETSLPEGRDRIFWNLLTNLPVKSLSEPIEKIEWYAMR